MATLLLEYRHDFWALGALPLGVALDFMIGKPRRWPLPTNAIQRLIAVAERGLLVVVAKLGGGRNVEWLAGLVLVTVVVGLVGSLARLFTDACSQLGGPATLVGRAILIYWGVNFSDVGRIGKGPGDLVAQELRIESIGAKANEAAVAPLFWLAIGGPAGLWVYQSIHALGRSIGLAGARSLTFGRASAQLDGLANLVPARLTWLLVALSAVLLGEDGAGAIRIGWRDGRRHPDPNVGWGEAALAGALRIRLGGRIFPGAIPSRQILVGDPIVPIDPTAVRRASRIFCLTGLHAAALAWASGILLFGT